MDSLTHTFILETAVGRARWCVWACVCREATRRQAGACNEARQRQARDQTYQRVRSEFTQKVNVNEGITLNIHAAFIAAMSGQLRFLGSYSRRRLTPLQWDTAIPGGVCPDRLRQREGLNILWFSDFRGILNPLSASELARFRQDHQAEIERVATDHGIGLNADVLMGVRRKPLAMQARCDCPKGCNNVMPSDAIRSRLGAAGR
jgi:hypothetical protein